MRGIKLVTFDATNTLIKFRSPPWNYYSLIAKNHGFNGTPDDVKGRLKDSLQYMLDKYPNFGKNTIFWQDWWRHVVKLTFKDQLQCSTIEVIANELINNFSTSKCWKVAEGSFELLRILLNRGICVGVVSNTDPRLHTVLTDLHLCDKLNFVLTSYEVSYSKPDKNIFKYALKISNVNAMPDECLHIGDDYKNDYAGAKNVGWNAVLIGNAKFGKQLPDEHIFKDLEELKLSIEKNKLKL